MDRIKKLAPRQPKLQLTRVEKLSLIILLLPIVAMIAYCNYFELKWLVAVVSVLVLLATIMTIAAFGFAAGQLVAPFRLKMVQRCLTAAFTVVLTGSAVILILASISNAVWGDTVTMSMVRTFSAEGTRVLEALPIAAEQRIWVVVILGVFLLCMISLFWIASRSLTKVLLGFRGKRENKWFVVGTPISAFGLFATCFALMLVLPHNLRGEPFSGFFQLSQMVEFGEPESKKRQALRDDEKARRVYNKTQVFEKKNVIVIIADALRADRMGVYGYGRETTPFLSGMFAKKKIQRVEMALSECSETFCGVAATLGSLPFSKVSKTNYKLHEVLKDVGYRTSFYLSGDHRSWGYLKSYYGTSIDDFVDAKSLGAEDINEDLNIVNAIDALPQSDGQPRYLHFHLMSSHVSSFKHIEFARYLPAISPGLEWSSIWNLVAGRQLVDGTEVESNLFPRQIMALSNRYDNGVLQADNMIWKILIKLQRKNYLANSIIVILGDHGDGLGEHGHFGHTSYLYQEDIHIPILIVDPSQPEYKNSTFATQADIAPTILDSLGLETPSTWTGRSLLQPAVNRITFHQTRREGTPCYAIVQYEVQTLEKYMRCYRSAAFEDYYFDLKADPKELNHMTNRMNSPKFEGMQRALFERFELNSSPGFTPASASLLDQTAVQQ
jgi:glucan phosphoethanolaminetransferase (alkaline phosphatase superfamily)